MSGISDFLFNGSPPPSVTTYNTTTTNLPQWMNDYLQGIAGAGNAIAATPYQPYVDATGSPIQRIAGRTDDQQAAAQATRDNFGVFMPAVNQSMGMVGGVQADAGLNAASGNLNAASGMNPLQMASPFLNSAGQAATSQVGNYMSPYQDQVVDRIGQIGARQLNERLIPAVGDQFTRSGQFGSARMQEATGRALRDVNEGVLAQQAQLMNQGYGQAMQAAQADLARQGQVGQTMGQLGLGQMGALTQIGQTQGNLMNTGTANLTSAADTLAKTAQAGQEIGLKDAAALQTVGAEQQALDQRNLALAYQDFLTQSQYPQTQLGWLSNLLKGYQMPTSTASSSTAPYQGVSSPSGLATIASGLGGIYSLLRKDGGAVTHGALAAEQPKPRGRKSRHRAPVGALSMKAA
jgi:hypothetical protein